MYELDAKKHPEIEAFYLFYFLFLGMQCEWEHITHIVGGFSEIWLQK